MMKPFARPLIAVVAAAALASGLAGCGSDDAPDDQTAEEIVDQSSGDVEETDVEQTDTEEADTEESDEVDATEDESDSSVDEDDSETYEVEAPEGFYVDNSDTGDAQLPEDFPADVPTIHAPQIQVMSEEGSLTWVIYYQPESLDVLDDFVANDLADWEQNAFLNEGGTSMYVYAKDNYQLTLQGSEESAGQYSIAYQLVMTE